MGREWETGTITQGVGAGAEVVETSDDDGCNDGEESQPPHRERHRDVVLTRVGDRLCTRYSVCRSRLFVRFQVIVGMPIPGSQRRYKSRQISITPLAEPNGEFSSAMLMYCACNCTVQTVNGYFYVES